MTFRVKSRNSTIWAAGPLVLFYRRLGYVVTGIVPDANGSGKPDIYVSKSARL